MPPRRAVGEGGAKSQGSDQGSVVIEEQAQAQKLLSDSQRGQLYFKKDAVRNWTVDEALAAIGSGYYHKRLLFACSVVFVGDAVEVCLLSYLQVMLVPVWDLTVIEVSSLASVVFLGEFLGCILFGWYGTVYGRKAAYALFCIFVLTFGFLTGFTQSFVQLLTMRFMVGVGIGGAAVPFDLLCELLPNDKRGPYAIINQTYFIVGQALIVLMAWLILPKYGWRALVFAACAFPFVSSLCYFTLPESPRWLMAQGRVAEAEAIMRDIARVNQKAIPEFRLVGSKADLGHTRVGLDTFRDLLAYPMRSTTVLLWAQWMSYAFCLYGLILLMPYMLGSNAKLSAEMTTKDTIDYPELLLVSAVAIPMTAGAYFLYRLVPSRKSQLLIYYFATTVAFGALTASHDLVPDHWFGGWAMVANGALACGSTMTWIYTAEIYPTTHRVVGHSAAMAMSRLGAMASPFAWTLYEGNHNSAWMVMGSVCFFGCVVTSVALHADTNEDDLPETIADFQKKMVAVSTGPTAAM